MRFRIRNGCSTFALTLAFTRFLAFCNSSTKFLYCALRLVIILPSPSRLPDGFSLSLISAVAPHLALLAVQQIRQHVLVPHRSRRRAWRRSNKETRSSNNRVSSRSFLKQQPKPHRQDMSRTNTQSDPLPNNYKATES